MAVPRPLYDLHLLGDGDEIIVTEGEKAAEAANQLGFRGTTSAHGARAAKGTDRSPLAGREGGRHPRQ